MKLINERLDYAQPRSYKDIVTFTANNVITKDGRLVMGAGAAKACLEAFPGVDKEIVKSMKFLADKRNYGFITTPTRLVNGLIDYEVTRFVGAFQTKRSYREPSTLEIIKNSVKILKKRATPPHGFDVSMWTYHMNFPGIGLGGLREEDVLPIIEELPDNVFVYKG